MTPRDWKGVMTQIAGLGCGKIQFIGGEPFLLGNELISLIEYARDLKFSFIEVFTNATVLTDSLLDSLVRNRINVAFSFYSNDCDTYEKITLRKGSYDKAVTNIRKMVQAGLEMRATVVGMKQNQDTIESTIKFLREQLGLLDVKTDFVRPSGRGCNIELVSDKYIDSTYFQQASFSKCTEETFKERHTF